MLQRYGCPKKPFCMQNVGLGAQTDYPSPLTSVMSLSAFLQSFKNDPCCGCEEDDRNAQPENSLVYCVIKSLKAVYFE